MVDTLVRLCTYRGKWGEMRPMVREKWKHKINFLMTSDPMRGCGLPSLLTDHSGNPVGHFMDL